MNELYIYHYLGLGDHIICNGIVRHYAKLYDKIYLFVKDNNFESVKFMYHDLNNIDYIVGTVYSDGVDIFVYPYLDKENLLRVSYQNPDLPFDESFYFQVGIPFEKRWSDFFVERDEQREMDLFNHFNINGEYIFLHDDDDRKIKINREYIENKNLRIITPEKNFTKNIFDYCYLIENAKEIHCIDSSFRLIADSINIKTDFLFYHINRGHGNEKIYSSSRNNWKKIKTII